MAPAASMEDTDDSDSEATPGPTTKTFYLPLQLLTESSPVIAAMFQRMSACQMCTRLRVLLLLASTFST